MAGGNNENAADDVFTRMGLTPSEQPQPELWDENIATVDVFIAMGSQWNVGGMGGVIGFNYASLPAVLDLLEVPAAERREVFYGLRTMERAAVKILNAKD